ncbi:MAG: hypothetical protein ABI581_14675 [Sediminibacterium sp.]
MKYSQRIGIIATIALMAVCFLPWSYIVSKQITVSGFWAIGTNYGKPGLLHFIMCVIMLVMFAVPAIWSKRTNVLIAALNLAWSIRNYLMLSFCSAGECPEKKPGLYLLVFLAAVIQAMALLPKMEIKKKGE